MTAAQATLFEAVDDLAPDVWEPACTYCTRVERLAWRQLPARQNWACIRCWITVLLITKPSRTASLPERDEQRWPELTLVPAWSAAWYWLLGCAHIAAYPRLDRISCDNLLSFIHRAQQLERAAA